MATPSTPPPTSPPPADSPSTISKPKTRQATRLRKLTARTLDQPRPIVNVNPNTGRGSGPEKEKFHSYLGVVAREKIPIDKDIFSKIKRAIRLKKNKGFLTSLLS